MDHLLSIASNSIPSQKSKFLYYVIFSFALFAFFGSARGMALYTPLVTLALLWIKGKEIKVTFFKKNSSFRVILLILTSYMLLTLLWTTEPLKSFHTLTKIFALIILLIVLTIIPPLLSREETITITKGMRKSFLILLGLSLFFILIFNILNVIDTNPWGHRLDDLKTFFYYTKITPGIAVLVISSWPVLYLSYKKNALLKKTGIYITILCLIFMTPHHTSQIAIIVSSIVFCISYVLKEKGLLFLKWLFTLYIFSFPVIFSFFSPLFSALYTIGFQDSWLHRLEIWQFSITKIMEKPIFGWGFDASPYIAQSSDINSIGWSLLPLHSHQFILQIWLELGAVGTLLIGLLVWRVFVYLEAIAKRNFTLAATMSASLTAFFIFLSLSFGIWQSWLVSTIVFLSFLFKVCIQLSLLSPPQEEALQV